MAPFIVSVIGGVVQDITTIAYRLPDDGETVVAQEFSMQPGGKGANSAVAIHRLSRCNPATYTGENAEIVRGGLEVRMVGAVGGDQFGPALVQNLVECGVNVAGVRQLEGHKTAVANILVEKDSGANRILQYPGVAYELTPEDFKTAEDLGGGVVPDFIVSQLEIARDAIEQALETAAHHGIETLLNPSPARALLPELYAGISHLVMNETEATMLSDHRLEDITSQDGWLEIAIYFHDLGVKNVVITLGEKGAFYSNNAVTGFVEAEKACIVIDSSGAGDSFVGGYCASLVAQKREGQWNIQEAVAYGCKAAARVIEHLGCLEPIAWANEVDTARYTNGEENVKGLVDGEVADGIGPGLVGP